MRSSKDPASPPPVQPLGTELVRGGQIREHGEDGSSTAGAEATLACKRDLKHWPRSYNTVFAFFGVQRRSAILRRRKPCSAAVRWYAG